MHIDVFADVVCPWCRIGKKNLSDALKQWREKGGEPATVSYRAFQLDPELPEEGLPFSDAMLRKIGDANTMKHMFDHVTQAGAAIGLGFRFDLVKRMPNTRLAHRFLAIVPEARKAAAVDALYAAYFEQGRDVAQIEEIAAVAGQIGADGADIVSRLASGEGADSVDRDLADARRMGIWGVPFFVFDNRFALSGAYPPDKMIQAMEKAASAQN